MLLCLLQFACISAVMAILFRRVIAFTVPHREQTLIILYLLKYCILVIPLLLYYIMVSCMYSITTTYTLCPQFDWLHRCFRFVDGWDEVLLSQLAACGDAKAVLSTYPPGYTLPDEVCKCIDVVCIIPVIKLWSLRHDVILLVYKYVSALLLA